MLKKLWGNTLVNSAHLSMVLLATVAAATETRDIRSVEPDLHVPLMTQGDPAPGIRVKRVAPEYKDSNVYHALYLPSDWQPGKHYPIIVEYAGNGSYCNKYGDVSTGKVEDSKLGYGISAGRGFIWICMPYVDTREMRNQTIWWGDVDATLQYCKNTVRRVCELYGGDPAAVILAGFSRGAIACGYLGLHDDEIADVWLAFIAYSHYDGVRPWAYEGSDKVSAIKRLQRLRGRASFICHEQSIQETKDYLSASGVEAPFTFQPLSFHNHNDAWVLRQSPERRALRDWLQHVLRERPGTYSVCGRVSDHSDRPLSGIRIQSGYTHCTETGPDGRYQLRGLIGGRRIVTPYRPGTTFEPAHRNVFIEGRDLKKIDFTGSAS